MYGFFLVIVACTASYAAETGHAGCEKSHDEALSKSSNKLGTSCLGFATNNKRQEADVLGLLSVHPLTFVPRDAIFSSLPVKGILMKLAVSNHHASGTLLTDKQCTNGRSDDLPENRSLSLSVAGGVDCKARGCE